MPKTKPLYIVFEGGEGSGKSTQSRLLSDRIGGSAIRTFEPGDTTFGQHVREILLSPGTGELDPMTEVLLMASDRAELMRQRIRPSLAEGIHVISDRNFISSVAYQGGGREIGEQVVLAANLTNPGLIMPDLAIIFAPPPIDELKQRLKDKPDRFEAAGDSFHQRVAGSYASMAHTLAAHEATSGIQVINISQEIDGQPKLMDEIHREVLAEIAAHCEQSGLVSPV